jgi:hypothetical protein
MTHVENQLKMSSGYKQDGHKNYDKRKETTCHQKIDEECFGKAMTIHH